MSLSVYLRSNRWEGQHSHAVYDDNSILFLLAFQVYQFEFANDNMSSTNVSDLLHDTEERYEERCAGKSVMKDEEG